MLYKGQSLLIINKLDKTKKMNMHYEAYLCACNSHEELNIIQEVWSPNWNGWDQPFFGNVLNQRTLALPQNLLHQQLSQTEKISKNSQEIGWPIVNSTTFECSKSSSVLKINTRAFKKQTLLTHYKIPEKAHA